MSPTSNPVGDPRVLTDGWITADEARKRLWDDSELMKPTPWYFDDPRHKIRRLRGKVLQERTRFLFTGAGFWDPQIGRVAESITWPFPTRCCRTRPFDHERDDD